MMGASLFGGPAIVLATAQGLGLDLNAEAYASLGTLPESDAVELLTRVATKVSSGSLNNPSKYIGAAVARGYTSNETYSQLKVAGLAPSAGAPPEVSGVSTEEGNLALQVAMQNAATAGVFITQEAANALMSVPSQTAASVLDYVARKHGELRDPSTYIIASIAKKGQGKGTGGASHSNGFEASYEIPSSVVELLQSHPHDITPLERKCIELNASGLWQGQQIDISTLFALRCLPPNQAIDILDVFASKGRGKGGTISNINNYLQAGVAKVQRGDLIGLTGGSAGYGG